MSDRVTLIIPSVASRAAYFRRVLIHLAQQGFAGPTVVSDHSAEDQAAVLSAIVAEFPQLDLSLRRHAPDLPFLERLADCAEAARTPYVVLHADDDFMHFPVLDLCTEHLDANSDTVMAKGRIAFFSCTDGNLGIFGQPGRGAPKPNMLSRLIRHMASFSSTLYAVHRREPFIDSCRRALAATENVIFWQYLQSCLMILEGKLKTFDELYYLRQKDHGGWQETLIANRDPEHWPLLIISPDFSRHLGDFRRALLAALEEKVAGPLPPPFLSDLEEALIWLMRHGLAKQQMEPPEPEEAEVYKRMDDANSPEGRFLLQCLAMVTDPEKVQASLP